MLINYKLETMRYLDITFGHKWDYIPLTKNYIESFLLLNLIEKQIISRIAMSASELLENAVKYSDKDDGIRMVIKKLVKEKKIELCVYNFINEKSADILIERIIDMNNQDPLQYYINKMRESVKKKIRANRIRTCESKL